MLSRISKISVFGIVAFMLAFGMTADEALAHDPEVTYNVTVSHDPADLRAGSPPTDTVQNDITFVLTVADAHEKTADDHLATPGRTVTIEIPYEWPASPKESTNPNAPSADDATDEPGEVTFVYAPGVVSPGEEGQPAPRIAQNGRDVGRVSGRNLRIPIPVGANGNGTYTVVYSRSTVPHRKGTYRFPITNANTTHVEVTVNWAASGSGKVTLSSSIAKQGDLMQGDPAVAHPYNGDYVVTSEMGLGNLAFKFEAAGSMPKDSTFVIRILPTPGTPVENVFTLSGKPNNDSTASVSGAGNPEIAREAQLVRATIKAEGGIERGNRITITIKNQKAPTVAADADPDVDEHAFTAHTTVQDDSPSEAAIAVDMGGRFDFTTTGPAGSGTLAIASSNTVLGASGDVARMAVQEGDDLQTLTFTIDDDDSLGPGAEFEIKLPSAFPAPTMAIAPIGGDLDAALAGHTTAPKHDSGARTLSGVLRTWGDRSDALTDSFIYRVGAVSAQGRHVIGFKTSTGPHGGLTEVGGDGYPRYIDVTAKHDSGSFVVKENGQPLVRTTSEAQHDVLELVFTAAGYMPTGAVVVFAVPAGSDEDPSDITLAWPRPRNDNGDSVRDVGEVTYDGKADFVISPNGTITATANADWNAGDVIKVTYKNVKVPKSDPHKPYKFTATSRSFGPDTNGHAKEHKIGAGRTSDGSGELAIDPANANSNTTLDVKLTFKANGDMSVGAAVEVTIPSGWPELTGNVAIGNEGVAATLTSTATTITATLANTLANNGTLVLNITGVTTPATGGPYEFRAKSKAAADGTLTALSSGPARITINQVTAGAVWLSTTSAVPGEVIGNVMIRFTAGAQMQSGSKVTVTIPDAFTAAFLDNNDGTDSPGEVSLEGAADLTVSGGGGTPWVLTATANAVIEPGSALTFTYKMVTAPTAEAVYPFTTMASIAAEQGLLPVSNQQSITVRKAVDGLAVMADKTSVFTGDDITLDITLWSGAEAGKALGNLAVTLSDGDAGGTFTPASAMISDNTSSVAVTYSSTTRGTPTLTAEIASLSLTASVDVEIKSKIRGQNVDDKTEGIVVSQGQTITVKAIGQAGTGTVTIKDSDDDTVGLVRALDPGELGADGDQEYERSLTLPDPLGDGEYTVDITINQETVSIAITVLNDQAAPTLSDASVLPTIVANGTLLTLTVKATAASESNPVDAVMADVSGVDSTQTDMLVLTAQPGTDNTYFAIHTVSMNNANEDGEKMVTFSANAVIGDAATATASVTLKNDVTAPELSDAGAVPSPTANGTMVTISVSSESGLTVMADASAIGGGMVALTEGTVDDGMDANGNGNGMDANGNGNGMDANGNGNGDNGMTDTAMPAGNGMYSGTVTVTDAADGDQTITITATDDSGNESSVDVTVTIDNTGAMLSDASAEPSMATNGMEVTLSVNGSESGLTVMADSSAIGGGAAVALTDDDGDNVYTARVMVTDAEDGEQMIMISGTDALGNIGEPVSVSVTVDNTAPTLSDASADPAEAVNGDMVTISVMGGESSLTVMADASELGGEAEVELTESADTVGSYSGSVEVNVDSGGDKMVSITATDALGNASEAVTVMVSVHEVTGVSFSPAQVSTGDTVTVTAMGTAGLTATFSVFDAEAMNIVDGKAMTESTDGGTYEGSFDIVVDAHPTGEYWVSASVGKASGNAEGALTIDHKAQFTLSIAAGTHAIHVPLDVTHIDGEAGTIETVGDLYDALGESVNFIITLGADGSWMSYLGDMSAGSMSDAEIGDDTGLIAVMKSAATLELTGNALGTGGISQISIEIGNNLVGVPLDPAIDMMISGALVEGVAAIAVSNAAGDGFHTITEAGQDGDGPIMGGVGYIVVATAAANIPIVGSAWENEGAPMAAPAVAFSGSQTPVLHVDGGVMDEFDMLAQIPELRVTVRNLSTGASVDSVLGTDELAAAYSATFVEFGRHAAKVGDVLEIVAHSPNPYVGVRPVPQIVISAEEVLTSRISLPDLELYEIPSETELLANYPNPFNPETWIPYRLAQAAEVTLDIYDTTGRLVRTIDVGFKPAAVYESRASAIYWDGRNNYGERVASGTYFYHLTAGDDYASTRRMVILK